ncbi:bifunctional metallophosphatase/5'-nucleotidase [Klenkia taihuensis]|uniref:2',3'-cyclic-nucleotide 2'-phosphodiesterase / 3'-nucleotidase n=1 Tax=Klenkia taihuensis TaxID=1225127 RepID=A0A1I1PZD1_9ACTN|nr:5'-nucleotidase C-terminal domain-containing protein [Klenkia taihuensis]GHE08283.1 multifunctional 2',3'-cyclic-nucleotide 2'-phosphodiesterase/5'-nucleotidase/3'-nucleotidase [Klenkia taihuensis]SFD15256.1 2',3'-cyclic-nucleotide 2'-phosphodiesterase / 3'-nucleotidase [Klenkia taihuensis]
MRRRTPVVVGLAAALALGAATPALAAPGGPRPGGPGSPGHDANSLDLTLLATTDVHGRVFDWDYFRDAPSAEPLGLARAAGAIDSVRAEQGADSVLVVDNGDFLQGTPLTYRAAQDDPAAEHPMAAAYDAVGYDAQVVGNHEFNYGLDTLAGYTADVDHPVLGANVVDAATGEPALQPYTLQRMHVPGHKPVTVGVLGLTTPGSAIWDRDNVTGLEFQNMVTAAQRWVPEVAAQADVVVVLSHAGVGGTSSYGPGTPTENPTDEIARTVPGIDVMVVGHSHRDVPEQRVVNEVTGESVLLTQPYRYGASVSRVDLDLQKTRGQWDVVSTTASSLRSADYAPSERVLDAVRAAHEDTVAYVNQVVATSTEELSAATSRYEDTPILDFIAQVQAETVDAALEGTPQADLPVLSVAAPFSRDAVFPQGDVTIRDIAGLYVYDNTLQAVELTGAQVRDYLEQSATYFAQAPATGDVDPASLAGAGGTPDYNYDVLSGVTYDIDVSRPAGDRITRLETAAGPVADDDRFVVAVNNYRRSGGGGFPHVSTAPVVYDQQLEIRQLLIDWASARGVIDPADFAEQNWQLVRGGVPLG